MSSVGCRKCYCKTRTCKLTYCYSCCRCKCSSSLTSNKSCSPGCSLGSLILISYTSSTSKLCCSSSCYSVPNSKSQVCVVNSILSIVHSKNYIRSKTNINWCFPIDYVYRISNTNCRSYIIS